jgi:hypothetical protein
METLEGMVELFLTWIPNLVNLIQVSSSQAGIYPIRDIDCNRLTIRQKLLIRKRAVGFHFANRQTINLMFNGDLITFGLTQQALQQQEEPQPQQHHYQQQPQQNFQHQQEQQPQQPQQITQQFHLRPIRLTTSRGRGLARGVLRPEQRVANEVLQVDEPLNLQIV